MAEAHLRNFLSRYIGVPIVSASDQLPQGAAVAGLLALQSREAGKAVGGVRAVYLLELVASDALSDTQRLRTFETLAAQLLLSELSSERDAFPMLDYQIALEDLSAERLRVRIEVEWHANS